MHKVFISYHHEKDQAYKEALLGMNEGSGGPIFIDGSVDTEDISDDLSDEAIREKIRDEYLRDTTVTIVLVGMETKNRKHVDWELYSSMFDGTVNKKSGVLVIVLPSADYNHYTAGHGEEEKRIMYPEQTGWVRIDERAEYERLNPYLPARVIDNLLHKNAKVSVVPWNRIQDAPAKLEFIIGKTAESRMGNEYDMSRPMRRQNS